MPCVLVCGVDFGDDNSVAGRLFQELQLLTAGTPNEPVWCDLDIWLCVFGGHTKVDM